MSAAWQRISVREQRLLLAMGIFLLAALLFSLIWQPTRQRLNAAERGYQQQLSLSAQLQQAQPGRSTPAVDDEPLSLRLSESISAAGLELHQMETDNDLLRLTLSGEAKTLLSWLDQAEQDGAKLQGLTLEKRDALLEARVLVR